VASVERAVLGLYSVGLRCWFYRDTANNCDTDNSCEGKLSGRLNFVPFAGERCW